MKNKTGLGVALATGAFLVLGLKGGVEDMAIIYVSLIVSGYKTFGQVPRVIQSQVKKVLIQLRLGESAE